jgi:hypothetical protein
MTFNDPRTSREVSGQLHVPAALPSGRESPITIVWEAGWSPELVWMLWRRENLSSYREPRFIGHLIRGLVIKPAELIWLLDER